MKRIFSIILTIFTLIIMTATTFAATSGTKNTVTMYVKTKANWYKPGRESITLVTEGFGGSRYIRGIYDVYKDERYYARLGEKSLFLTIELDRNRTHTIKVVYNKSETEKVYKKETKRNMNGKGNPRWRVWEVHKVESWW